MTMLACEQARRGWSAHVGVRRRGVHQYSLYKAGVRVHSLGDLKGANWTLAGNINYLIKSINPDIIHTWLPQMDIVGGLITLWNSVPWVASERTNKVAHQGYQLTSLVRHCLVRSANAMVANSSSSTEYWRSRLPASGVFHVENAIDLIAIKDALSTSSTSQEIAINVKEILVVGRLTRVKALEIILHAVCRVPESYAIHVSIFGEGPLLAELEAAISLAGIQKRVTLRPYCVDWWKLLRSASMLISVSRYEGQPNVVLETMAAGCPLIVSDIPAHREILDESSAVMVPLDSPAALAKAIVSVLTDPISARERAFQASSRAARYTIEATATAYESVYKMVLARS